jgi:hypothetical protein
MNGCCNLSRQGLGPSRRAKSGSTADTAAGGPFDDVTVTILNADKRRGPALDCRSCDLERIGAICRLRSVLRQARDQPPCLACVNQALARMLRSPRPKPSLVFARLNARDICSPTDTYLPAVRRLAKEAHSNR